MTFAVNFFESKRQKMILTMIIRNTLQTFLSHLETTLSKVINPKKPCPRWLKEIRAMSKQSVSELFP